MHILLDLQSFELSALQEQVFGEASDESNCLSADVLLTSRVRGKEMAYHEERDSLSLATSCSGELVSVQTILLNVLSRAKRPSAMLGRVQYFLNDCAHPG